MEPLVKIICTDCGCEFKDVKGTELCDACYYVEENEDESDEEEE